MVSLLVSFVVGVVSVYGFPWCIVYCVAVAVYRQAIRNLHWLLRMHVRSTGQQAPVSNIVVLIPTFNVAQSIARCLERCINDAQTSLIVVADGGSKDNTVKIARAVASSPAAMGKVEVVEATAMMSGRANCLNLATCVAIEQRPGLGRDETAFVFLHGDTVLPSSYGRQVAEALADPSIALGAFSIYTETLREGDALWARLYSRLANALNNLRSRYMETPYGDQALFCRRSVFEDVGGFPPLPLMEDSAFVQLARDPRLGRLRILPATVRTLLGEKRALGILFFLRNYLFLTSWFLGLVSPDYLFSLYYPSQRQPTKISYAEMVSMRAQTTNQQAWTRAD